jgi:hypothetical protein
MFTVTIQDLIENAVYEGQPYTYTVIAETSDGIEIPMESSAEEFSKGDIGSKVGIIVAAQSMQPIEVTAETEAKLVPGKFGSVDIHGHVVDIDPDAEHPLEISIDDGSLRAYVRDIDDVETGDWVVISGAQLYLQTIKTEEPS